MSHERPCKICKSATIVTLRTRRSLAQLISTTAFLSFVLSIGGQKINSAEVSSFGILSRGQRETSYLDQVLAGYKSNEELEKHLRDFSSPSRCGDISRMFSIGKSASGVDLWALEIALNPGSEEAKPRFKYVGNMHGDEPTGRVLQLALAEWLCANWKSEPRARQIVEGMKLYLLPTMNPDGFARRKRENRNGIDLNRDFPDPILLGEDNLAATGTEQPETLAVMQWIKKTHFVASASMHEGAYVANYPWDGSQDRTSTYAASPDDETFKHLARSYASIHAQMNKSTEFAEGITNGAAWYPLWGGMQDWNYLAGKCLELTLELSLNKWPPASDLPAIWDENRASLINLPLIAVFGGARGFVFTSTRSKTGTRKQRLLGMESGKAIEATISVDNINYHVTSSAAFGDFYRPLAPGWYNLTVTAAGHHPKTTTVMVPGDESGVQLNFTLDPFEVADTRAKLKLPRRFGAFDENPSAGVLRTSANEQEVLISEVMWINMMQNAVFSCLGILGGIFVVIMLRSCLARQASAQTSSRYWF